MVLRHFAAALVLAVLAPALVLVYHVFRAPTGSVRDYRTLTRNQRQGKTVVACLGDSHTHGFLGADWVSALREMAGGSEACLRRFRRSTRMCSTHIFVNAGENANLAWNVNQRLQPVLDMFPDAAVVLIGSNDVMGSFSSEAGKQYVKMMKLPQQPSQEFFRTSLRGILSRLQARGVARRAVLTLPPLGENPHSRINKIVADFNGDIMAIATETNTTVLDLHERLWAGIRAHNGDKPPADAGGPLEAVAWDWRRTGPMISAVYQRYLGWQTWDAIADMNGLVMTSDRVHLSSRGGAVLQGLVADFVGLHPRAE